MSQLSTLTAALLLLLGGPSFAADLQVIDPWVREPPPNASAAGGFMILKNDGEQPIVITAISSPISKDIEIHRTVHRDGIARMVHQDKLTVPAHGELVMEPGSYHAMIFNPPRLKDGEQVEFSLQLADGEALPFTAEVRRSVGGGGHHHQH